MVDWPTIASQILGTIVILARMRAYVTVEEYRTKVASLHAEINDLKVRIAVAEVKK